MHTDTEAYGVAAAGDYVYVADGTGGLRVIDISDPVHPVEGTSTNTDNAEGVALAGRYAYVADRSGGLKVIDLHE